MSLSDWSFDRFASLQMLYNRSPFMILKQKSNSSYLCAHWVKIDCGLARAPWRITSAFFDCMRFIIHRYEICFTTDAAFERHHAMKAEWRVMLCQSQQLCLINNMISLHLVSCHAFISLIVFLGAVIIFVVFFAEFVSFAESNQHIKIVQRLYRWTKH